MIRILLAVCCLVACLGLLWTSGCQNSGAYTAAEKDSVNLGQIWEGDTIASEQSNIAICVWPVVGLRREPGRKNYTSNRQKNYLVSIYYGERVEMLGELDTVESENRVYMKIRLQDGEEGWVYEELFEKGGKLAVVIAEAELYRRPDLMTLRDEYLEVGEIIVVLERKDNWIHISGDKKAKKGWVKQVESFSFRQDDLKAALLMYKAMQGSSASERREKLSAILSDPGLKESSLIPLVESHLEEIGPSTGRDTQHDSASSAENPE